MYVVVVMPAYNAAETLEQTYHDIPRDAVDKIILVDDVSHDETVEVARQLGLDTIIHLQNKGYGGNQKTCYLEALKGGADIVVMLHPDNQYDSTLIPELIAPIVRGEADIVLGSRFLGRDPREGGMPQWKVVVNRFLTVVENLATGLRLSECHTGFRAYSRRFLETIPFLLNSDKFLFDTQVIYQAVAFGFRIAEISVPARYFREASSVGLRAGIPYGLGTLWTTVQYVAHKRGWVTVDMFHKSLVEVVSRYHRVSIFGAAEEQENEG
jgi:glycosyltransferase involved in cell wall biosynthesis